MGVAASLQSTNKAVLDNVRRSNISLEQLTGVAREGSKIDANTYAEIILNLPGDTLEAHTQSLRDAVNSGLSYIRMYQLIMLPETDMNTAQTREQFGMKTMWRIMPRCFGRYPFQGEEFNSAEIEEICIAQDSLSFGTTSRRASSTSRSKSSITPMFSVSYLGSVMLPGSNGLISCEVFTNDVGHISLRYTPHLEKTLSSRYGDHVMKPSRSRKRT
jgi:hypothetical protein